MGLHSALTGRGGSALEQRIRRVGPADVVVAIPSFNDERTIGHVVRVAAAGLRRHFHDVKAVLVVCDGGSTDATEALVARTDIGDLPDLFVDAFEVIGSAAWGVNGLLAAPGDGSALRSVFPVVAALEAKAACVLSGRVRAIAPERLVPLLSPVLREGYDFVAPLYAGHDGSITTTIVYPLTRALYGRRIRPPLCGDLGFSARLAARFLEVAGGDEPHAPYGTGISLTTMALAEGFRVAEASLGTRIHDPRVPGTELAPLMADVISALFSMMERHEGAWKDVRGSEPVPRFGPPCPAECAPGPARTGGFASLFCRAAADLTPIWASFLSGRTIGEIRAAAASTVPRLGDGTWATVLAEAAAGFHRSRIHAGTLAGALVPLYLGKVASIAAETECLSPEATSARLEGLALAFERGKEALVACWDGRDG